MARKKQDEREAFYSRNLPAVCSSLQDGSYDETDTPKRTVTTCDGTTPKVASLYDFHATVLGLSIALSRCSNEHGTGKTLRGTLKNDASVLMHLKPTLECTLGDLVRYGYGIADRSGTKSAQMWRNLQDLEQLWWRLPEPDADGYSLYRILTAQKLSDEGPLRARMISVELSSYFARDAKGFGQMPSDYMVRLHAVLKRDTENFNKMAQSLYERNVLLWKSDPEKFKRPDKPKPKRTRRCTTAHICLAILLGQQDRRKPFCIKMSVLADKIGLRKDFLNNPGRTLAQLEQVVRDTCEAMGIERALINYQRYAPSDPPRAYSITISWAPAVVSTTSTSAPADASPLKNSSQNKSPRKKPRT